MSTYNAYIALSGAIDATVQLKMQLRHLTGLKIGGPAELVVRVYSFEALTKTIAVLEEQKLRWCVLGSGTSILAADKGYDGCVILLDGEFRRTQLNGAELVAGAAAPLKSVVTTSLSASLSGIEPLVGIPGSFGGAIAVNAGSGGEAIEKRVSSIVTYHPKRGIERLFASDLNFGERGLELDKASVILEASLKLYPAEKKAIGREMDARLMERRAFVPMGLGTACAARLFEGPEPAPVDAHRVLKKAKLAGFECGWAQLHESAPNYVINTGGASAQDILQLTSIVHEHVFKTQGVELKSALNLIGFGD